MTVKAIYEDGAFKPKEPVGLDSSGWKTADELVGFIKNRPRGVPIAAEHDKYLDE